MNDRGALALFSGGQDSATCLAWALERFDHVETIGFDYGQRHRIELECRDEFRASVVEVRPEWANRLGPDHMLDLSILGQVSKTALTSDAEIALREDGLPNTFVPGRNLLFLHSGCDARIPSASTCTSSVACVRPTIPAIPIAAMIR